MRTRRPHPLCSHIYRPCLLRLTSALCCLRSLTTMFGGGEEHFAAPEEFDVQTLKRYAALCGKLRTVEKMKGPVIVDIATAADAVGPRMVDKEIAAGAIMRHIKCQTGAKQLCAWYVLDHLAKQHRAEFGFVFGMFILELGTDCIPWENVDLSRHYEKLVNSWSGIFNDEVIKIIFNNRGHRVRMAANPVEMRAQMEEEERVWEEENKKHQEIDGLDEYAQPCLAYMQGNCAWGNRCTQIHPPGLERTLPMECRIGDWRCPECGFINRHFRRRCTACPKEKPQYRRSDMEKRESEDLCCRKVEELKPLCQCALGYDPLDADAAVAYWNNRLPDVVATQAHLMERRRRYRGIIAAWQATRANDRKRVREEDIAEEPGKAPRLAVDINLPAVPAGMAPADVVFYAAGQILNRGARDKDFPGFLFLLTENLKAAVRQQSWAAAATKSNLDLVFQAARLTSVQYAAAVRTSPSSLATNPATPFFDAIRSVLALIPFEAGQLEQVQAMCTQVLGAAPR